MELNEKITKRLKEEIELSGKIEKRDCKSDRRVETDRFAIPFRAHYAITCYVCQIV